MPVHNTVHIAGRGSVVHQLHPRGFGARLTVPCPSDRNARLTARLDDSVGQGRAGSSKSASALSFSR